MTQRINNQSSYMAFKSSDAEIEEMTSAVSGYFDQPGMVTFSNIFSLRSTRPVGVREVLICALVRHEGWEPGEYKNVHYRNGEFSLLPSNNLTGACDASRYEMAAGFTMVSGRVVRDRDEAPSSAVEAEQEESASTVREIVEVSELQERQAQQVIQEMLKDPESARFRRLYGARSSSGSIAVCGEVNAKNSYGGYTGYKPFLVLSSGSRGYIWNSSASGYSFDNMLISEICPSI